MAKLIESDDQLSHEISMDISRVMNKVMLEIKNIVTSHVYEFVYKPYTHLVSMYRRQFFPGGFFDSWEYTDVDRSGDVFSERAWESTIFSNPDRMYIDPYQFIHSNLNKFGGVDDNREELAAMLAEGYGYSFPTSDYLDAFPNYKAWWTEPRDYWTPTIELLKTGYAGDIFVEEMKRLGVGFWNA
jgi:hypothetical protein